MKELNQGKGLSIVESIISIFIIVIIIEVSSFVCYLLIQGIELLFDLGNLITLTNYCGLFGRIIALFFIVKYITKRNNLITVFIFRVKEKIKIKQLIFSILLLIGYFLFFSNSIEILLLKIKYSQEFIDAINNMTIDLVYTFIFSVLIAPIFEEIVFRGIILEQLSIRYNIYISILVSALLFAIFHFDLHQGINSLLLGITLGFIYNQVGSLLLNIVLHLVYNFYIYLCIFISSMPKLTSGDFNFLELVIGTIFISISYYFLRKYKHNIINYEVNN